MAGILFEKNNSAGYLQTSQYHPQNTLEAPIFNYNGYRNTVWLLLERGPASDNSPVVRLETQHRNGGSKFAFYVRLDNGRLKSRLQTYDEGQSVEFTTVDPVPVGELLEVAAVFSLPGDSLKLYINGASVPVTQSGYYPNTSRTVFHQTIQVVIGKGDSIVDIAKDLYLRDLAIIPQVNSGVPSADNYTSYYGVWRADFSHAQDLKLVCTRDNGGGDAPLSLISSGVAWTELDGFPDDSSSTGGIIIPGNGNITTIQGTVTEDGAPVARRVFAITQSLLEVAGSAETKHAVLDSTLSDPTTGDYALDTSPYEEEVMVLAMDNFGQSWQPDTEYQVGDVIRPTQFQGYVYICTVAGTSDSTEPQWWFDTENNQAIGTAQFKAKPYTRPLAHGPLLPEIIPS